ncbi:MAG: fibronectin type III domain-containing protein [Bacteroidales bacterium]|nr:fibronectin type III domain-containing protein [Bacteroidales bacterium]
MKRFMFLVVAVLLGFAAANAQGTATVVVADGSATNSYVPIYGTYVDDFLRCQTIYPESMLAEIAGKEIQALTYYLSSPASASWGDAVFEIKMGTATAAAFSTPLAWVGTESFTTVYTGSLDGTQAELAIDLTTPYTYTGGNLCIEVNVITEGTYKGATFAGMASTGASVRGYDGDAWANIGLSAYNASQDFIPKTGFTVPVSCAAPTFGTITPSETSALIAWTEPNAATRWSLKVNNGAWTTVTENPYTLTGLTSNTPYTLTLRSICTDGDTSFSTTTTFRTTCGAQSMPYNETFESYTAGTSSFVPCWVAGTGDASYVQGSRGYNSDKAFNLRGPAIVASPVITVGGQNVVISFDMKRQSDMAGTVAVGLALSPEMMAMATYFDTIEPTDNEYHNYEFEFNNTLNIQSGCLVFKQLCEETTVSYWLDNLDVRVLTDCKRPAEGEVTDITPSSVTVSWTAATAATAYEVAYGGTQNVDNADSIIASTATTLTIGGLESEETYYTWVRTVCGEEKTMWRYIGTFETEEPCVEVVNARVATVTTNAIALNWSINSTVGYASTKVLVEYKASDATEWTSVETTNNYFMLTGLEGGVTYNFRVRNICGTDSADVVTLTASTQVCGEVAGGTTTTSYIPTSAFYNYSYSQAVYTSDEVGNIGTITGISYKNNSSSSYTRTVDVYMANVENASLNNGYLDISDFTQVASGYEWTIASGWSEIVFDVPFVHQAGYDIVVAIDDNTGSYNSSLSMSAHSGSARYENDDYDDFDPNDPPEGSSSSNVPDIRFTTICNTECEAPLAVVSNVDVHSVTVMWTPMGSESSWTVGYKASGESEWTTVSNNVSAHEYTVSGLNAGTNYQIRIGANCDGDTSYANLSLFTDCDVMDVPYTENFNGSVLNPCWAFSSTYPTLSNGQLYNGYSSNTNYAILPQFSAAINTLRINFDAEYTGNSTNGKLQIGVVSNQDGIETFTMVDSVVVSSTASHYEVMLNNYSGTGSYIAIKFMTTYVYVDNVVVDEIPNCVHPTALTLVNAGENSMTLQWTENGSATQWVMKVDDGAWTTVTNPYTINGLNANTVYTVSVASLCGGDTSEVESGTFRTACGMESLPYMEGFESYDNGAFPACWTLVSGTSYVQEDANSYYTDVEGNSLHFGGPAVVATPVINVGGNNLYITFDLMQESNTYSGTMAVGYAASPAAAENAVYIDTIDMTEEDEWINYEYTFENTMNIQTGCLVFKQVPTTTDWYYWLDNLTVSVVSDCQRPDSGSVTNMTPIAATATWSAVEGATGYEVAYGTSSEVNQALETLPASGTTLTLTNLTPNTTYYAWVRTVCGTEQALWRSLGSFTTQPACAQVENARVINADVTELTIGWRLNEEVGYASTAVRVMYKKSSTQWSAASDTTVTGTTLTLTGLEAGSTYNFRIFNICSEDTASMVTLNGTTDVACAAVVDAQVLSTAMTALAIGWTIDSEVGYASTSVLVKYKEAEAAEWTDTVVTGTNLILTGLTSGTAYNFSIRNICSSDTSTAVTLSTSTNACGEVGDGSSTIGNIPINVYYMYSYSQAIYTDAEVGNIDTIHGISYNYNGTNNPTRTIDVYIADVENASLANGCLDISQFTQVATNYSWSLSNGWNQIVFSEPFVHESGKDIVIAVDDNTGVDNGSNYFKGHAGSGYSYYQDSAGDIDPTSPSATNSGARTTVADIRFDVTCNVTCPAPILVVDEVGSHDAALSWVSLGEETSWTVEYRKASDTVWTSFNNNITTTSCTIENLEAATGYQFRVGANCADETAFASASATTECAAYEVTLTQDYTENFDATLLCWSMENNGWYRSTTGGHTGGMVYTYYEDRLITPQLDCSTLALGAQIKFWYKNPDDDGDNSIMTLYYRTSEDGEWTAIESATFTTAVENWTEVEMLLPGSENAPYYQIVFESEPVGSGWYATYLYLDDIVVEAAPTCPRVHDLTLDAVTNSSATFRWTSDATLFDVKYRTLGGAWTTVTPAPTTGTVELTGLESATAYEFNVRAICTAGDTSRVATYAFRTECDPMPSTSLPYFEGFEDGFGCWNQEMIRGNVEWNMENDHYDAYEGNQFANLSAESRGNETRLTSPIFDLSNVENVKLTFAHAQEVWPSDQDSLKVEYRLSSSDEWHVLATYTTSISEWQVDSIQIPQVSSTFQLAFHGYANYGYGVVIDSLTLSGDIVEIPTCAEPTNVTTSNLTANTVTVTWTGSAAQYEVEIIGGGQTISETVNTNSYTTEALTQETEYTFRVRALCENGLTSDWSAVETFTTPQPECGVPTNVQTTTTATTVTITWTGYATEYDVKVTGSEIAPINRTVMTNSCTVDGLVPASTYQVVVRAKCDGLYTDWTEAVMFHTADGEGIENAEGEYSVSMYPNPAKEQVSIRIEGMSGKVNVAVIDMSGRTVMSDMMENGEAMLNVSTLAKGTYFVRLNGEGISTVRKLVVQ